MYILVVGCVLHCNVPVPCPDGAVSARDDPAWQPRRRALLPDTTVAQTDNSKGKFISLFLHPPLPMPPSLVYGYSRIMAGNLFPHFGSPLWDLLGCTFFDFSMILDWN